MARRAVGVEVNGAGIRVVALRRGRRGAVIEGFGAVDHGGAVGPEGVVEAAKYRQAFEEALARAGAGRVNLCVAVAYPGADVRELEFPVMPQGDLEYTIRFELSNVVRTGRGGDEELAFDYAPLPGDQQHGKRRLLSIAAPRRIVRGYLDPLYGAGIYPEILEIGAFSLPWIAPREGGVGYVHTGLHGAQVLVYEAEEFRVARQVSLDLRPLVAAGRGSPAEVAAAAETGGVGGAGGARGAASQPPDAGAQTAAAGGGRTGLALAPGVGLGGATPAPPPPNPAETALEELVVAVERTLDYHRARRRASVVSDVVDGLILSGELGRDSQLARDLGRRIGVPTTLADPIIGPGDARAFGEEAPLYAVAAGMAVRGLEQL